MFVEWDRFWWESIPGPSQFLADLTASVLDNNGIFIVVVPNDLPWRQQMVSVLDTKFENTFDHLEVIDCSENPLGSFSPARFLINYVCPSNTYRSSSGLPPEQYLYEKGLLQNQLFWIKGIRENDLSHWLPFVAAYHKLSRSSNHGFIILEITEGIEMVANRKQLLSENNYINYIKYVTEYDVRNLLSIVLNASDVFADSNKKLISYFVALAANLFLLDVEAACVFCQENLLSAEPEKILCDLLENKFLGDTPIAQKRISDLLQEKTLLDKVFWKSQVEALFHLIEAERIQFIDKYKADLKRCIDDSRFTPYDKIETPFDMQIGLLKYIVDSRFIKITDEERCRIKLLWNCRNNLAHLSTCTLPDIISLVCESQLLS